MSIASTAPATFAARAGRLAGAAGAVFGWSPDTFWQATPAEFAAVVTAITGSGSDDHVPPDAATIARLKEAYPDGG
ncbi:phage tail assembly chaperone [Sphingomonas sp. NBWT7]|uniref:phage tail assembly chaperone n=1 Tax=Sphingomonas sp. NBWT7 TaxID=2596913 RepID=UPI0016289E49|nr:phage tail assembly chaperone [Sphingomonas sp. NBWT7]QNE32263.1 phage tail assembly chaperone [Sphingomonas sp. NBWT7]